MEEVKDRVICRLKSVRVAKKLSQSELAERVGIKRQAVYDMESGRYMPNTLIALRLARELGCRVEDLFMLEAPEDRKAVTLAEESVFSDARVSLAHVRHRLVAYPMDGKWLHADRFQAADGLLNQDRASVQLLQPEESLKKNIVLLGCDPAFALLSSHVSRQAGGTRLQCRFASSLAAVKALAAGHAHAAGTHMHNTDASESNISLVRKMLTGANVMVFAFSMFEEGLMVAPGNPLNIRSVGDLGRGDVRMVNREQGAALRTLLDDCLAKAGIPTTSVKGYDSLVSSHNQGAQVVAYHLADAALGLRAVAVAHGLDFVPIQAVRCDLVIPYDLLDLSAIKILLDVLQTRAMRKELGSLPGYDASSTGKLIGEVNCS